MLMLIFIVPTSQYIDGKCIINIGSVGLPFDGLAKTSYALVDIHKKVLSKLSIIRVGYDIEKTMSDLRNLTVRTRENDSSFKKCSSLNKTAKSPIRRHYPGWGILIEYELNSQM